MLRDQRARFFFVVIILLGFGSNAPALEVRRAESEVRYRAELTRAYAPCLAPNDVTLDGFPACSPTVSSACGFDNGTVELRIQDLEEARTSLDVFLNGIFGPGPCHDGPYTLKLRLRVTADGACGGESCTFQEFVVSRILEFRAPDTFQFRSLPSLEELLPLEVVGMQLDILGATIMAPDGRAVAATGIGYQSASVLVPMGAGYRPCEAPDTSGGLGPACTQPVWPSACDMIGGVVEWHGASFGSPLLETTFKILNGSSPDCADGTYLVDSQLRITTECVSGSVCTAVDVTASVPVTAERGKINGEIFALESLSGFASPMTNMEVYGIAVRDPAGAHFATGSVTDVSDLKKPKISLKLRDPLSASDDLLRLDARFPLVEIDPTQNPGVTFTVTDRNGPIYEVTIPGALWQLGIPIGTRWDFDDPSGGISGVTQARISRFNKGPEPAGYKIKLAVRGADLSEADLPGINVTVSIPKPGGSATTSAQRNRLCKISGSALSCK